MIRSDDLNPESIKLDHSCADEQRLFQDTNIDVYWCSKTDFFLMMTDLEVLTRNDIVKCSLF